MGPLLHLEAGRLVGLAVWAIAIVYGSILWNEQVTFRPNPTNDLIVLSPEVSVGGAILLGALAGALIGRNGGWPMVPLLAAIGALLVFLAFDSELASDVRACNEAIDPGCDITGGISAAIVGGFSLPLLLAGAGVGRLAAIGLGAVTGRIRGQRDAAPANET